MSGTDRGSQRDNAILCAAVEQRVEMIGEAMAQLIRLDEALVQRIIEHRHVVAFRNTLIHGYAEVNDRLVLRRRGS